MSCKSAGIEGPLLCLLFLGHELRRVSDVFEGNARFLQGFNVVRRHQVAVVLKAASGFWNMEPKKTTIARTRCSFLRMRIRRTWPWPKDTSGAPPLWFFPLALAARLETFFLAGFHRASTLIV